MSPTILDISMMTELLPIGETVTPKLSRDTAGISVKRAKKPYNNFMLKYMKQGTPDRTEHGAFLVIFFMGSEAWMVQLGMSNGDACKSIFSMAIDTMVSRFVYALNPIPVAVVQPYGSSKRTRLLDDLAAEAANF